MSPLPLRDEDEGEHNGVAVEAWWFWGMSHDRACGVYIGLELRAARFDYWAGLVRVDEPYLYIEELDGTGRRAGLELKPPEMWADHVCDRPFAQWSLGNEAHGVLLDDPTEAWRRAHGTLVPVTFDIEWYANEPANAVTRGYSQSGEVDVQIELTAGVLAFEGPAERVHVWGAPFMPSSFAMPIASSGLRAPYRRSDGTNIDQVLTDRWWATTIGPAR